MGRRPRATERLRPAEEDASSGSSTWSSAISDAAREALVRHRDVPGADAPPRPRMRARRAGSPRPSTHRKLALSPDGARRSREVLVTGSRGYIGSVLVPVAGRRGPRRGRARQRATTRGATSAATRRGRHDSTVDVRDVTAAALSRLRRGRSPRGTLERPDRRSQRELTYEINLDGTVAFARAAKEAGVKRFVFASSCSMYGASGGDALLAENAPLRPLTAYAESKVRAEEGLAALGDDEFVVVSHAERDGLRRVAAAPARHRPEQPRRRGRTRPGGSAC